MVEGYDLLYIERAKRALYMARSAIYSERSELFLYYMARSAIYSARSALYIASEASYLYYSARSALYNAPEARIIVFLLSFYYIGARSAPIYRTITYCVFHIIKNYGTLADLNMAREARHIKISHYIYIIYLYLY